MKIGNPETTARIAQGAYEIQTRRAARSGAERVTPVAPSFRGDNQGSKSGFAFTLGKLGIRYEVEEPPVNAEELARQALGRFQRQQDAAFRAELEVEELRRTITAPPAEASAASGEEAAAALPEGSAPQHLRQAAQRAYQEAARVDQTMHFRPGVHIGTV